MSLPSTHPMSKISAVTLNDSTRDNRSHLQLIGTLLAAIAYGFIICITFHTMALLITNKRRMYTSTMRTSLLIYIVVMFALSTASAIQAFIYITSIAFTRANATTSSNIIKMNEPLFLPLTIFGADGFMLWRSVVLYQNTSVRHRVFLYGVLFFISTGSLASAVLYYMAPRISAFALKSPLTPSVITISITTFLNFILTSIIAGRLFYHQETMQRILGKQYRTPHMRIIVMLVESCSLIVVTGIVFLVFVARGSTKTFNGSIVPFLLLPHVCVASPLIIVYQVAKGRAITRSSLRLSHLDSPNISGTANEGIPSQPIRFNRPTTSTFNQDTLAISEAVEHDPHTMPQNTDHRRQSDIHDDILPISPV